MLLMVVNEEDKEEYGCTLMAADVLMWMWLAELEAFEDRSSGVCRAFSFPIS